MSAHYIKGHSHRIGIVTVREGTQSLTVAVLPKLWNRGEKRATVTWTEDQAIFHLYENQSLRINIDDPSPYKTQREGLIAALLKKAKDEADAEKKKNKGSEEEFKPLVAKTTSFSETAPPKIAPVQSRQLVPSPLQSPHTSTVASPPSTPAQSFAAGLGS